MKRGNTIAALITLALLSVNTYAWSADYSTMSTREMSYLLGTMQGASPADRNAFNREWSRRVEQMTPAERQQYMDHGMGMDSAGNSAHTGNMGHEGGGGMGGSGGGNGGHGGSGGMGGSGGGGGMGGHGGGGGMGGGMGH